MRDLLTLILFSSCCCVYSQKDSSKFQLRIDTCIYPTLANGSSTISGKAVYIANGILVSGDEIEQNLVTNITILDCPRGFLKYGHVGASVVIDVTTTQVFDFFSQNDIQTKFAIKGNPLFTVNCFPVKDTLLKFSKKSIIEIEVITEAKTTESNTKYPCINIWTIDKKQRSTYNKPSQKISS